MNTQSRRLTCALVLFGSLSTAAQEELELLPPARQALTTTAAKTLSHGVRLLASGDFEFAAGHFRALRSRRPSHVYINVSAAPMQHRRRCLRAALEAMAAWNDAAPETVEFVQSDHETTADVRVYFEFDVLGRDGGALKSVCGKCQAFAPHDGKRVDSWAIIRVAVFPNGEGQSAHNSASLVHVVGHELGHALGLGESRDPQDLMGPDRHREPPSTRPSPSDLSYLRESASLYADLLAIAERNDDVTLSPEWREFIRSVSAAAARKRPEAD